MRAGGVAADRSRPVAALAITYHAVPTVLVLYLAVLDGLLARDERGRRRKRDVGAPIVFALQAGFGRVLCCSKLALMLACLLALLPPTVSPSRRLRPRPRPCPPTMQVVDPMRFPGRRAGAAAYPQGMVLPWTLQPSSAYTMDQAGVRPIGGEPLPPSLVSSRDALLPLSHRRIFLTLPVT